MPRPPHPRHPVNPNRPIRSRWPRHCHPLWIGVPPDRPEYSRSRLLWQLLGLWHRGSNGIRHRQRWRGVDRPFRTIPGFVQYRWLELCNGGFTAHKYHFDTLGQNQTSIGAVLETDDPYTATDGTCSVSYNHPYQLSDWQFVDGNEFICPRSTRSRMPFITMARLLLGFAQGRPSRPIQAAYSRPMKQPIAGEVPIIWSLWMAGMILAGMDPS